MTMQTETTAVAEFIRLECARRNLDEEIDKIKKEQAELQQQILDDWADQGIQSIKTDKGTLHIRCDFVCNKRTEVSRDEMCKLLEANGLGELVAPNYNAAGLKSWVKEQLEQTGELPEALTTALKTDTIPRLVLRAN